MNRVQGLIVQAVQQAQKMSVVAKVMCGLIAGFYFLSFAPAVEDNLVVTPAYIMPPMVKIWTLVTATFYERRIVLVFIDIIAIIGFASVLQPYWDLKEFILFTGIVSTTSLLSGVLIEVLLYAISQSVSFLFVPYHGMVALLCGFIVAVKQFHPDSVPLPPPTPPTLRVKHMPLTAIIISFVLSVCGVTSFAFTWLALSGVASSWVYLRFFQKNEHGSRGDMSESFAFATFFPEPIQPALSTVGGFIYHLLVSIRVCPKIERTYDVSAPSHINITLPGADRMDAQRRKQRALKALDERLSKTSNQPQVWPSMDDTGSSQDEHDSPPPSLSAPPGPSTLSSSTAASQPPPPPPPEMVVVQTIPGGGGGGEGGGVTAGKSLSSSGVAVTTKTNPDT